MFCEDSRKKENSQRINYEGLERKGTAGLREACQSGRMAG